jgi:hypothetical protein
MWCVAELDEEYIARMEDVLALYEKPLSEADPVVCVDEKPVLLHAEVRAPRPMRPGRVLRRELRDVPHSLPRAPLFNEVLQVKLAFGCKG